MIDYLRMAEKKLSNRLYKECIKFCDRQIDTGNQLDEALMIRSMAKAGLGFDQENTELIEDAIEDVSESIKHNPDEVCAFKLRAHLYAKLGQFDKTNDDFNQAVEIEPSCDNFLEIGEFYRENQMTKKSMEFFKNAMDADETQSLPCLYLGDSFMELELYDEAEFYYDKATQLGDEQGYIGLAKVQAALRKYDEALELIDEVIKVNTELPYAYLQKGLLHLKKSIQKPNKRGKLSLEEEFSLCKHSVKINKKQTSFAIKAFKDVIALDKNYFQAYLWLLLAYNNFGRFDKTVKVLNKMAELFPLSAKIDYDNTDSNVLSDLCHILRLFKNYETAVDICTQYLDINNDDAAIYLARGEAQYNLGNYEEAKSDFYYAKELGLDSEKLYLDLGLINFTYENYKEAFRYLNLAAQKDYEEQNDTIYFMMALTQNFLHEHQEALDNINIAISINPKANYYSVKADINDALGNYSLAIKDRECAANIDNSAYYINNSDKDAVLIQEFCQNHLLKLFNINISLI